MSAAPADLLLPVALLALIVGCLTSTLYDALRDFSLRKLEAIANSNGGVAKLQRIIDDPMDHAAALGALRALCSVTLVLVFGAGLLPWYAGGPIALVLSYVFLVVLPASLAEHAGERLIHASAGAIHGLYVIATPLRTLHVMDVAIKRLAGQAEVTEQEELEDEILSAVSEGEREGALDQKQGAMIEAVVGFAQRTVEEIMTPRTEIEGFELTDDLGFICDFIETAGHSRIPVYEGDLDHIVGILYAKDLIPLLRAERGTFELRAILREGLFVPETKPLDELLTVLQSRKIHLAIVLDEYGGTTGLVTFEDLIEEIVGEIQDEYEPEHEQPPVIEVSPDAGSAEIEARAYIDDANNALERLAIELPKSEDYDTVGGYVLSVLGHIPQPGETFAQNGHTIEILEAEPTRVHKLRIIRRDEGIEDDAEAAQASDDADAEAGGEG
ncbi:MAG: hemolysin family protein [Planctomycetota bacterium]